MTALNRPEKLCLLAAIALSPLWFLHPSGINLGLSDVFLITAAVLWIARTRSVPVPPTRLVKLGLSLFFLAATVSLVITPRPLEGLLNYIQYCLIFFVAVPFAVVAARDTATRWQAYVGLLVVLNLLVLATGVTALRTGHHLRHITFWYANQNLLYWLVASASVFNLAAAASDSLRLRTRVITLGLALLAASLTIGGETLSAYLILAVAVWLFSLWQLIHTSHHRGLALFIAVSIVAGLVGFAVIWRYWDWIYVQGSLHARIPMYRLAIMNALGAFPFGTGLESSEVVLADAPITTPSIHNVFLAYFLELGVAGVAGFTLIVVAWIRGSFLTAFQYAPRLHPFEASFVCVFAGVLVMFVFQPVPVQRYYWYVFGLSWGVVIDISSS